jgi:hypothetical protein
VPAVITQSFTACTLINPPQVTSVPAGFNHTTILWAGGEGEGVTATVLGWGEALRALHGASGGKAPKLAEDVTTSSLGAWTDAGRVY